MVLVSVTLAFTLTQREASASSAIVIVQHALPPANVTRARKVKNWGKLAV
jgi:hypothetical protein